MLSSLVGLSFGTGVCGLWCSWVGDELANGEPRKSKELLQVSASALDIVEESIKVVCDRWRSNSFAL